MLWRDPSFFWLLPAVAALAVLLVVLLRRRAAALQAFVASGLVERLAPDADRRRVSLRTALRLLALLLIVVALAGPKVGFRWQEVKREGIDLIVAIDTSRSMLATDVKPDRLERAKLAVLDLVPLLQGDRIGLVAFAGTAFLECPLTLDYAAFERSLRAVEVGLIPRGGTALGRAIDTSLDAFEARQGKFEALILITDGEDNEGELEAAATRAAERGVKIYTVGIGTSEGELLPLGGGGYVKDRRGQVVKSRLNEDALKEIALQTGGAYVQGLGPSLGLDQVFRDHIATMERREVASTLERRYEERFQIPLALGVLLLLIEWAMPLKRRVPRPARRRAGAAASRAAALLMVAIAPLLVGFFDPPGDRAAEGNTLYSSGKYEEAAGKYGEGLVDAPQSPLLQFNLATALYKQAKYDEAIASFQKAASGGQAEWVARANYNMGNAYYRLALAAESSDPQAAIANYEQALASYKRSMVADGADPDPKFNHEFVANKLAELKKKLEEEKQKQEQEQQQEEQPPQEQPPEEQQQNQEQQQEEQQQQDQAEQQEEQLQPEQQPQDEQQQQEQQQEAGGEEQQQQQQPSEQEQQQGAPEPQQEQQQAEQQPSAGEEAGEPSEKDAQAAGGVPSDEKPETAEERAAQAVLDTARGEEVRPEDIARPSGVVGAGDPSQDW